MKHGLRAMAHNLRKNYNKKSIKEIVDKYSRTDRTAYKEYLADKMKTYNIKETDKLDLDNEVLLKDLMKNMISFETTPEEGKEISDSTILNAINMPKNMPDSRFQYPPIPKEKPKKMEGGFVSA
jgi:hypothetical protein